MANATKTTKQPFVTVVVPVYNDAGRIGVLIERLLAQSYPKDRYEVIIVDNGSSDETGTIVAGYPVVLLEERAIQSSYAARNKGIVHACGEVVVFTDSDCVPEDNWLEAGVMALRESGAVLAGGNVRFRFRARATVRCCQQSPDGI